MKFFYSPQRTRSPETGEERFVLRPVVPILICGEQDTALFTALVDSDDGLNWSYEGIVLDKSFKYLIPMSSSTAWNQFYLYT